MTFLVKRTPKNGKPCWVVDLRVVGAGRKFFPERSDADRFSEYKSIEFSNHGAAAFLLSADQRVAFMDAERKLDAVGATIGDAVAFYLKHARAQTPKTIAAAIDEIECVKTAAGRSKRYVNQLRYTLDSLAAKVGKQTLCHEIRAETLEQWLNANGWALRTRKGYLIDASTFFAFCVKRGYAPANPAASLEPINPPRKAPGILSVAESKRLLFAAKKHQPGLLPFIVLGLFCGLRPAEIFRLQWSNVSKEFIRLDSAITKTKQRRIVDIPENARAWLKLGGDLPPVNWQDRLGDVRRKAKLKTWPHDCLRHSFCSYHLALHQSAEKTALQAGHSPQILFEHYRELVPRSEAERFFALDVSPAKTERLNPSP